MGPNDKLVIQRIIEAYDRVHPTGEDSIALCVLTAQQERDELRLLRKVSKTGVVKSSDSGRRLSIVLPENLWGILRRRYPKLFTEDLQWFKKNFKMFTIK